MYGEGISHEGEILDLAVKLDVIQKSGSWFAYGDKKLGQGRDKTKEFLRDNPGIASEIENKVRKSSETIYAKPSMARNMEAQTSADLKEEQSEEPEKE